MENVSFRVSEEYQPCRGICEYRLGAVRYITNLGTIVHLLENDKKPVDEIIYYAAGGKILTLVADGKVAHEKMYLAWEHQLSVAIKEYGLESDEAEAIRCRMDNVWKLLTQEQQNEAKGIER